MTVSDQAKMRWHQRPAARRRHAMAERERRHRRERERRGAEEYWAARRNRAIFGELVEDACGAVWSAMWRRGR